MTLLLKYQRQMSLLLALLGATFSGGPSRAQEKDANQPPVNSGAAEHPLTAAVDNKATAEPLVVAQNTGSTTVPENSNATKNLPPNGYGNNARNGDNARNNRPRFNARQQRLEEELRRAMSSLGCIDASVQDAVLEYIREETKARRPLLEQSRRLFFILRTSTQPIELKNSASLTEPVSPLGGMPEDETIADRPENYALRPAVTKEQIENDATLASQIVAYRAALEADRTRHKAAEADLDSKIKFSQNPRLEAMLLLMGIIGDSPNLPLRAGAFSGGPPRLPTPRSNPPANVPPANEPVIPNMAEDTPGQSPNNLPKN